MSNLCPLCGSNGAILFTGFACENVQCDNYVEPEAKPRVTVAKDVPKTTAQNWAQLWGAVNANQKLESGVALTDYNYSYARLLETCLTRTSDDSCVQETHPTLPESRQTQDDLPTSDPTEQYPILVQLRDPEYPEQLVHWSGYWSGTRQDLERLAMRMAADLADALNIPED